ncbi:MAG: hypothetical protein ACR2LC_06630 [Pyrinomonadaceae bacterium]
MSSKLTVIFYIVLCLEVGIALTVLPWLPSLGFGDWWGDNYFLLYAGQRMGLRGLQHAVASGWVRGAVTGLGLLNLATALWEITHFRRTTRALQGDTQATPRQAPRASVASIDNDAAQTSITDPLSDYKRHDDKRDGTTL